MTEEQQVYFEDVEPGATIPEREFGPHTLVTAVAWAGVQENPGALHFDRDYVRQFRGAHTIVASGALRQSYLASTITDWTGPRGFLRKMSVRHTSSTYEGDMQRYSGTVIEKSSDPEQPWVVCDLAGRNQDGQEIIRGRCTITLPRRSWAPDRPTWGA